MSGHSHWSQIQRKKDVIDQKRGRTFSKLLAAISIAARDNPDPQFNPRLRTAIEKARAANVPNETIKRALQRSADRDTIQAVTIEAYGPSGSAVIIEGITDNRNRTIAEVRHILNGHGAKFAEPGSVLWSFEKQNDSWHPKFKQVISPTDQTKLSELITALESHPDVQCVTTNAAN
jgi:YebC/PmpR family DNA-binding regulatory protein